MCEDMFINGELVTEKLREELTHGEILHTLYKTQKRALKDFDVMKFKFKA